jgi:hypothetical protein
MMAFLPMGFAETLRPSLIFQLLEKPIVPVEFKN